MKKIVFSVVAVVLLGAVAQAHFQMIYTPEAALTSMDRPLIALRLLFMHPFEGSVTMSMGAEEEGSKGSPPPVFGVVTPDNKFSDLRAALKPAEFSSLEGAGRGYACNYQLKGMGDFIFLCDPGYYWEPDEDCFIRHVTKVIVNRGGAATGWDQPVAEKSGIPCEILPLDRPYALWAGNVFRGQVLKDGKPVAHAEVEVEYLNHDIDLGKERLAPESAKAEAPQEAFVTQTIRADSNGVFTYGLPREGWWGFSALGLTDEKYKDKDVELAALIWVQAKKMR